MRKILLTVCAATLAFGAGAVSGTNSDAQATRVTDLAAVGTRVEKRTDKRAGPVFQPEKGISGLQRYIIQLAEPPVASYRGGINGMKATSPEVVAGTSKNLQRGDARRKLRARSPEANAYRSYLQDRQAEFRSQVTAVLGFRPKLLRQYRYSLNGMTLRMTQDQALQVAQLPGVKRITRDIKHPILTDRGPWFIGADKLWEGAVAGISSGSGGDWGEGIIVGIMDTGINGDHPSFADIADDGFDHTNPYGAGNYKGECFQNAALVCNDKLVGRYNFTADGPTSEDQDGHGSHVGSTAVGNVLYDVPIIDAEGNPSDFTIDRVSGVAPRANIIGYRVCVDGCFSGDIIAAVDQAIVDGVDVLNHSIGSAFGSPWDDAKSQSFKAAREAGISIANSAGNSGPEPFTVDGATNAPWAAAVAASTHDRDIETKLLHAFSGGDTPAPAAMVGRSITLGLTAPIVYAGDYDNPNDPGGDPAQCLQPFPAGTFNGEIVVCDRGAIARVQKGINVRDGGAGGYVLANVQGGDTFLADDPHVIPGIQISADDGDALKAWLASGTGHVATIDPTGAFAAGSPDADVMAGFSSRGPYPGYNFLAPAISAPGVAIYAATADPIQWEFLQGTSMSSPHIAGSLAMLKDVRPEWTDAEMLSAMMLTATTEMRKEDFATAADPFDFGGGRVRLDLAAASGLVLDEIVANFDLANPAIGGDPRTLNIASMVDMECLATCTWQRTVEATTDGTWTTSGTSNYGLPVTVEPASFTLTAGQTQVVTVTADVRGLTIGDWVFGEAVMTPERSDVPEARMPIAANPASSQVPDFLKFEVNRDSGSRSAGNFRVAEAIAGLEYEAFGLTAGEARVVSITGETQEFSPYTGNATAIEFFFVPEGSQRLLFTTSNSESPDVDLFVGRDNNEDGEITPDEELCQSGTEASLESCELIGEVVEQGGTYWAAVINYATSAPGAVDDTQLNAAVVAPTRGNAAASGPSDVDAGEPFGVRVFWDQEMLEGNTYYGAVRVSSVNGVISEIIPVDIDRGRDDVIIEAAHSSVTVGDTTTIRVDIGPNLTTEDLTYVVDAEIPDGFELVPGSVSGGYDYYVINGMILWVIDRPSINNFVSFYEASINGPNVDPNHPMYDAACTTDFGGYIDLEGLGLRADPSIAGDSINFSMFSGQDLEFYGNPRTSLTLTDNGFGVFASGLGSQPWANRPIPNPDAPNDMVAPLWTDLEIVYDQASNSGVTMATGGPGLSIVEFDNMQRYPAGSSGDMIDFEIIINGNISDAPGDYEIIFGYDNIVGDWDDVSIGVENSDGSGGSMYTEGLSDGLLVCWDYVGPEAPIELTYRLQAMPESAGQSVENWFYNIVDNPGAKENSYMMTFDVAVGDTDSDGFDDTVDNCLMHSNPDQRDTDGDGFGNRCDPDFNQDGIINFADMAALRAAWGTASADQDLNGDGTVSEPDLDILRDMFLGAPGPGPL